MFVFGGVHVKKHPRSPRFDHKTCDSWKPQSTDRGSQNLVREKHRPSSTTCHPQPLCHSAYQNFSESRLRATHQQKTQGFLGTMRPISSWNHATCKVEKREIFSQTPRHQHGKRSSNTSKTSSFWSILGIGKCSIRLYIYYK